MFYFKLVLSLYLVSLDVTSDHQNQYYIVNQFQIVQQRVEHLEVFVNTHL